MCGKPVEHDPIYEAPCGHEDHGSAVFHPLCLMEWREDRDALIARMRAYSQEFEQRINEAIERGREEEAG